MSMKAFLRSPEVHSRFTVCSTTVIPNVDVKGGQVVVKIIVANRLQKYSLWCKAAKPNDWGHYTCMRFTVNGLSRKSEVWLTGAPIGSNPARGWCAVTLG